MLIPTIVLITEINITDEFGVDLEEALGEVCMDGSGIEEAHVERRLANTSPLVQKPTHLLVL